MCLGTMFDRWSRCIEDWNSQLAQRLGRETKAMKTPRGAEEQWSFHPGWSPRSPTTSIFEGQIPQNKAFYTKQNTGNLGHFEGWSKHSVDGRHPAFTSWYIKNLPCYIRVFIYFRWLAGFLPSTVSKPHGRDGHQPYSRDLWYAHY